MTAKEHFEQNVIRVKHLGFIYQSISSTTTNAIDLSDILRAQYVMLVSAIDYYIHELIRTEMLEIYAGNKKTTKGFKKFLFSIDQDILMSKAIITPSNDNWLNYQILYKNGFKSFQHSSKISEALELIIDIPNNTKNFIWKNIANQMRLLNKEETVCKQLNLIVDRRNQIAHEADIEPTYQTLRIIKKEDIDDSIDFIESLVQGLDSFIKI